MTSYIHTAPSTISHNLAHTIELARKHRILDPSILAVYELKTPNTINGQVPIGLLMVNTDTPPQGFMPLAFGTSASCPYPQVIADVTPEEFSAGLKLPDGWSIGLLITGEPQLRPGQKVAGTPEPIQKQLDPAAVDQVMSEDNPGIDNYAGGCRLMEVMKYKGRRVFIECKSDSDGQRMKTLFGKAIEMFSRYFV